LLKEEARFNRMSLTKLRTLIVDTIEKLKTFDDKWYYPAPQELDSPSENEKGEASQEDPRRYWERFAERQRVENEIRPSKRFKDFVKEFPNLTATTEYMRGRWPDIPAEAGCSPSNGKMYQGDAWSCASYFEKILEKYPRPQ